LPARCGQPFSFSASSRPFSSLQISTARPRLRDPRPLARAPAPSPRGPVAKRRRVGGRSPGRPFRGRERRPVRDVRAVHQTRDRRGGPRRAARMRRCRPVAGEECAILGEAQAAHHMSEIHRHLSGERGPRRAARGRLKIAHVHVKHRRNCGIDHLSELRLAYAHGGSPPRQVQRHRASATLPLQHTREGVGLGGEKRVRFSPGKAPARDERGNRPVESACQSPGNPRALRLRACSSLDHHMRQAECRNRAGVTTRDTESANSRRPGASSARRRAPPPICARAICRSSFRSGRMNSAITAPKDAAGCWRSFGAHSGPSEGARSQAVGAMTSIGILA
jgi:hypothetical protein